MRKKTIYGLLCVVTLAFCLAFAPSSTAASTEEEVLQVAENFAKAMNTADFDLMSSLWWHSPKTTHFAPFKVSPFLTQGWEALEIWWKTYLGFPAGTFICSIHNPQVTMLEDNIAIITFYQTFVGNPPVVKEQSIAQVRGTFVVQKIGGKWLIVHEHSSGLPVE